MDSKIKDFENQLAATKQLPGAHPGQALVIVNDRISPDKSLVWVDTEGQASTGILRYIDTTNTHDGMWLHLMFTSSARNITVKHSTETYGIRLVDGVDKALPGNNSCLVLRRAGNSWKEIATASVAVDTASTTARGVVQLGKDVRVLCSADLHMYFRNDGNDGNDGMRDTADRAKKTLQGVIVALHQYDLNKCNVYIHGGSGIFDAYTFIPPSLNLATAMIQIEGAGNTTILRNATGQALYSQADHVYLKNIRVEGTVAAQHGKVYIADNVELHQPTASRGILDTYEDGFVKITAPCKVSGQCSYFLYASTLGSKILVNATGIDFAPATSFSVGTCYVSNGGNIAWHSSQTWTGSVTGPRYYMHGGGTISTVSANPNIFLPGDKSGVIAVTAGNSFVSSKSYAVI